MSGPSHGALSLNSNGSFTFTPTSGYTGTDSFTYQATDTVTSLVSNTATVSLTITDTAPVAANDSYSVHQGQLLKVAASSGVLANDTDAEGDTLHATLVSGPSHAYEFGLNSDGSFGYSPTPGFTGTDSFTYTASDGILNRGTATVTIHVTDTAPVAASDAYVLHGGGLTVAAAAGVLHNDTDSNGDSLSAVLVSSPGHSASFSLNADGLFSYVAASGYGGSDSFTYQASDGVLQSGITTVTLAAPTLSATGVAVTATAGTSTGTVTVATVTDTDMALTASGLTATIQWGDGSSSTATAANGGITGSAGAFSIQGIDTYFAYGVDPISVTLQDTVNGLSATASSSATISRPLTLSSPGNQTSTEGTTVSLSLSHTYSGTGTLTYDATGLPAGLAINPSTGTISGTVVFSAVGRPAGLKSNPNTGVISGIIAAETSVEGSSSVAVTATDGMYESSQAFTWTVNNPISILDPGVEYATTGNTITGSIQANDASGGTLVSVTGLDPEAAPVGLPGGLGRGELQPASDGIHQRLAALLAPLAAPVAALDTDRERGLFANSVRHGVARPTAALPGAKHLAAAGTLGVVGVAAPGHQRHPPAMACRLEGADRLDGAETLV